MRRSRSALVSPISPGRDRLARAGLGSGQAAVERAVFAGLSVLVMSYLCAVTTPVRRNRPGSPDMGHDGDAGERDGHIHQLAR